MRPGQLYSAPQVSGKYYLVSSGSSKHVASGKSGCTARRRSDGGPQPTALATIPYVGKSHPLLLSLPGAAGASADDCRAVARRPSRVQPSRLVSSPTKGLMRGALFKTLMDSDYLKQKCSPVRVQTQSVVQNVFREPGPWSLSLFIQGSASPLPLTLVQRPAFGLS